MVPEPVGVQLDLLKDVQGDAFGGLEALNRQRPAVDVV